MKPYSEACDQNKDPILDVLKKHIMEVNTVFEIGSGTGQHAVYFAQQLPHLQWHPSDVINNHAGIMAWINDASPGNVVPPTALDVNQPVWPEIQADTIFSANTTHIMDWNGVNNMFSGVAQMLIKNGLFILYGPFNYDGKYTSMSNEQFDKWLKARDPLSGIRAFEDLDRLANENAMRLLQDYTMPANNRILIWQKL